MPTKIQVELRPEGSDYIHHRLELPHSLTRMGVRVRDGEVPDMQLTNGPHIKTAGNQSLAFTLLSGIARGPYYKRIADSLRRSGQLSPTDQVIFEQHCGCCEATEEIVF